MKDEYMLILGIMAIAGMGFAIAWASSKDLRCSILRSFGASTTECTASPNYIYYPMMGFKHHHHHNGH